MRGVHTKKTKQLELSEEYPFTYSITTDEGSDGRTTSAHAECYFKAKDLESRFVITYAFDPRVLVRTILGEYGRQGRCVGHDPQGKRDVVVRVCGADEILPIGG